VSAPQINNNIGPGVTAVALLWCRGPAGLAHKALLPGWSAGAGHTLTHLTTDGLLRLKALLCVNAGTKRPFQSMTAARLQAQHSTNSPLAACAAAVGSSEADRTAAPSCRMSLREVSAQLQQTITVSARCCCDTVGGTLCGAALVTCCLRGACLNTDTAAA
jgi:hypothetical protein